MGYSRVKVGKDDIVAYISDIHFPSEDPVSYKKALSILKTIKPSRVVLGGDIVDLDDISRYPKRKIIQEKTLTDLKYAGEKLTEMRDILPNARFDFLLGNHEDRLDKFIMEKAPELSGFFDLRILLKCDKLDIKVHPHNTVMRIGKLNYSHGDNWPGGWGMANPARSIYDKCKDNIIFGHFHRISNHSSRTLRGRQQGAWGNGCLQRLDVEFNKYNNWQHGISMVYYAKTGGYFHVEQIRIHEGVNFFPEYMIEHRRDNDKPDTKRKSMDKRGVGK